MIQLALRVLGLCVFLSLSSCMMRSEEYQRFYAHLRKVKSSWPAMQEEDYFLILLVNARHLDYTHAKALFRSIAKHPTDGSKNGDVGHAWIYLQGKWNGKVYVIEGGHSGERNNPPVPYFDGIMNYNEYGYANPTIGQLQAPRYEPNPIRYLWTIRNDGFFQKGSGGHRPTFAAKVSLTRAQFEKILSFIHPSHYSYRPYAFLGPQCCHFVTQVAALAELPLSCQLTLTVAPSVFYRKYLIRLWENPCYANLTFATPDVLEKSLIEAVETGKAEYALDWYLQHGQKRLRRQDIDRPIFYR